MKSLDLCQADQLFFCMLATSCLILRSLTGHYQVLATALFSESFSDRSITEKPLFHGAGFIPTNFAGGCTLYL